MKNICPALMLYLALMVLFISAAQADDSRVTGRGKSERYAPAKSGYFAIIIGNNDYKYLPKLKTAVNDAREVEKLLKEKYGFRTTLLLDASRADIIESINKFRRQSAGVDNLIIYYAGHGEFDKTADKAYWLPVDARIDSDTNWIIVDEITSSIKRITAKHILIVADSCYSGTLTRAALTEMKGSEERAEYLKKMSERPSRTLMASGGNEPVSDSSEGNNSVFAEAFLTALRDIDKSIFTAEELFYGRVKSIVAGKSDQVPEYAEIRNSGHSGGDFVFQLAKEASTSPAVKVPEVQLSEAPKSSFSLDEYEKKAAQEEANKAAWNKTLKSMKDAYNRVLAYQDRNVSPDLKAGAWDQFLNSFTEKNPYSSEDDEMRQKAREEMEKRQAEQAKVEAQKKLAIAVKPGKTGGRGKEYKDATTGMEFVLVKGGCYQMGDTSGFAGEDEKPVHEVCVDDFYLGKYDVTQGQWNAIMGNNPSIFEDCGDNCPVENVSWNDVQEFINKLNIRSGTDKYRLPTEAEWEYAARSGGKQEKYAGGNDIDSVAWYGSNSGGRPHPVGMKAPNGLGLYDMSGNVFQWVRDWFGDNYYSESPRNNPTGPNSGRYKVVRGGSWNGNNPAGARAAYREWNTPSIGNNNIGFRLALSPQ